MKSKSIYRSCQYRKQLNSIGKDPNYYLITPNGIIGPFIVFIEVEELGTRNLVIPVGITRSESVKIVEVPGMEHATSWLVVRHADHSANEAPNIKE